MGCTRQGYGDHKPKSSTAAQEVKTLDGIYTEQVNGGPHQRMLEGGHEDTHPHPRLK